MLKIVNSCYLSGKYSCFKLFFGITFMLFFLRYYLRKQIKNGKNHIVYMLLTHRNLIGLIVVIDLYGN
jgi:hypothetical protein